MDSMIEPKNTIYTSADEWDWTVWNVRHAMREMLL